jgi:hypothetical protein
MQEERKEEDYLLFWQDYLLFWHDAKEYLFTSTEDYIVNGWHLSCRLSTIQNIFNTELLHDLD